MDSLIRAADEPVLSRINSINTWHVKITNWRVFCKFIMSLPFAKNLLGSEAVLSKSSSLVIKLSRCKITSVAISQNVRACNDETAYKLLSWLTLNNNNNDNNNSNSNNNNNLYSWPYSGRKKKRKENKYRKQNNRRYIKAFELATAYLQVKKGTKETNNN